MSSNQKQVKCKEKKLNRSKINGKLGKNEENEGKTDVIKGKRGENMYGE